MQSCIKNRENGSRTDDLLLKVTRHVINVNGNTLQKAVVLRMLSVETVKRNDISLVHA